MVLALPANPSEAGFNMAAPYNVTGAVLVLFVFAIFCWRYWSGRLRGLINANDRGLMKDLLHLIDADEHDHTSAARLLLPIRRKRSQIIAAALSRDCRAKFRIRERSAANELVVHKWMYDQLCAIQDLRKADIPFILDIATELVFIPSAHEVELKRASVAASRLRRDAAYATRWWDWGGFLPEPTALVA